LSRQHDERDCIRCAEELPHGPRHANLRSRAAALPRLRGCLASHVRINTYETGFLVAFATAIPRSYVLPQRNPGPPSEAHWIELASPRSVKHGTEFIIAGADAGRFTQLRVDDYAGTVILLRIRVFDRDGTVQTVPLGRMHRSVVIDLPAFNANDQIAIATATRTQGKYTVYGSSLVTSIAAC
jgi:hypothetical protein